MGSCLPPPAGGWQIDAPNFASPSTAQCIYRAGSGLAARNEWELRTCGRDGTNQKFGKRFMLMKPTAKRILIADFVALFKCQRTTQRDNQKIGPRAYTRHPDLERSLHNYILGTSRHINAALPHLWITWRLSLYGTTDIFRRLTASTLWMVVPCGDMRRLLFPHERTSVASLFFFG